MIDDKRRKTRSQIEMVGKGGEAKSIKPEEFDFI